jgi:hypothetical protein
MAIRDSMAEHTRHRCFEPLSYIDLRLSLAEASRSANRFNDTVVLVLKGTDLNVLIVEDSAVIRDPARYLADYSSKT